MVDQHRKIRYLAHYCHMCEKLITFVSIFDLLYWVFGYFRGLGSLSGHIPSLLSLDFLCIRKVNAIFAFISIDFARVIAEIRDRLKRFGLYGASCQLVFLKSLVTQKVEILKTRKLDRTLWFIFVNFHLLSPKILLYRLKSSFLASLGSLGLQIPLHFLASPRKMDLTQVWMSLSLLLARVADCWMGLSAECSPYYLSHCLWLPYTWRGTTCSCLRTSWLWRSPSSTSNAMKFV